MLKLREEEKIDEMFRYLEIYKDSLSEEEEITDVEDMIRYYGNNWEGLLPYQSQRLELPDPPEGLEYPVLKKQRSKNWVERFSCRKKRSEKTGKGMKIMCKKSYQRTLDSNRKFKRLFLY